ncbi:MAG: tetratricopeptide repeat protein [Actinomycetota bacterium]
MPEPSQRAFACLSACASHDFGVRAAAAAAGVTDPTSLLSRLTRLSLLEINQVTARYRFHPLVDDYARRLGDRWSLTADARHRHGQAMTALLRNSADGEGEAILKLLEEQADIRHAIDYMVDHARIDLPFLQGLNRLVERAPLGRWHQEILEKARARFDPASQAWLNAVLLLQRGKRASSLDQLDEARQAFAESLEIGRRLPNERHTAMVLNSLGGVLRDLGRMDEAGQAFEDSLAIRRWLHDERGEAMVLTSLGVVLRDMGCMDEARQAFEESLAIDRWLHDKRGDAMVLTNLGWWFREQGDPEQALKALEEARAIKQTLQQPIPKFFKGELTKLRQWVNRLADGTGRLADYHLDMAIRRINAKDWPGAVIHMRHNLALDDSAMNRGERLENLAFGYFKAERRADAISVSTEALALGFANARLCANLGRALHLEGGCLQESGQFLRRSLDLNRNNAWAWSWLGLVLADQGNLEDAENHARRALVGHEEHAVLIHHLALVLVCHPDERADKLKEALNCCEQAEKFADFPFPHPTQLAVSLRQRLQSLGTRQNPST